MTPISQAVTPPQPNTAVYGAHDLEIFKGYDRAGYFAAFGVDAPTYDKSRPVQPFFDSDAASRADANGHVDYKVLSTIQPDLKNPKYDTIVLTVAQASTVNLYGVHSYPTPESPTKSGATTPGATIDAKFLSMEADAAALMGTVGGSNLMMEPGNAFDPIVYAATEPRRLWGFLFKGTFVLAGPLLGERDANGLGAPGHWDTSGGEPNWISELPQSLPPANPALPIPQRELLTNEILIPVGIPGAWGIQRTDMENPATQTSGSGAGLTQIQDANLSECAAGIKKLLAFFRL